MAKKHNLVCKGCGKSPDEILEYKILGYSLDCSPSEAVRSEEGTFDAKTNTFYCTKCYVIAGCPLNKERV